MSKTLAELNAIVADEAAYQKRTEAEYKRDLAKAQRGTKEEKEAAAKLWLEHAKTSPELVAERIDWIFDGSYGYGACVVAWKLLDSGRLIVHLLLPIVAGLEWMVPTELSMEAIGKLDSDELTALHAEVHKVLDRLRAKPLDERPVSV